MFAADRLGSHLGSPGGLFIPADTGIRNIFNQIIYYKGDFKMQMLSLENELKENSYPGRGIVIGKSPNGKYAVTAYFIMGRSENSRNRIFVEEVKGQRGGRHRA